MSFHVLGSRIGEMPNGICMGSYFPVVLFITENKELAR
jgi:hypothetical protein